MNNTINKTKSSFNWQFVIFAVFAVLALATGQGALSQGQSFVASQGIFPSNSYNWSGYAATGGSYTGVGGTWTVPAITSGESFGTDATWVGIGGTNTKDLIQGGTQAITNSFGSVSYRAWIETLPSDSQTVDLAVRAGDSITTSIVKLSGNQWQINLTNNTTGQSFQTTVYYNSSLSSAEWIQEKLTSAGKLMPMDNFGAINFSSGWTIKDGTRVTIAQSGAQPITMQNFNRQTLVAPSTINSDGASFSVSLLSAPVMPVIPASSSQSPQTNVSDDNSNNDSPAHCDYHIDSTGNPQRLNDFHDWMGMFSHRHMTDSDDN